MCGIAGICHFNSKIVASKIKAMTDTLIHRGPDGEGCWINANENVGLGHRRLAIMDLTLLGQQPMISGSKRYVITFNGEIYNHIELRIKLEKEGWQFRTTNDTEVLLALYEQKAEKCLSDLDGMFSFAIWDNLKQELFCARDRFGEKPFYYFADSQQFIFASEMKALWVAGVPRNINFRMAYNYEFFGYKTNPEDASETFFQNISALSPGHYLIVKNNTIVTQKYYSLNTTVDFSLEKSEKEVSEKLRALVLNSITKRLRGQVNVGSSFSGGLDSSIIVSLVEKIKANEKETFHLFSAIFPDFLKNEEAYIRLFENRKNLITHYIKPDFDEYKSKLKELFYFHEDPFTSSSVIAQYFIYQEAKKNNTLVLLDGQGADEVFAGYHQYFNSYFRFLYKNNRKLWRDELSHYRVKSKTNPINHTIRSGFYKYWLLENMPVVVTKKRSVMQLRGVEKKRRSFYKENLDLKYNVKQDFLDLNDDLKYQTFQLGLPALLRYCDRNSMANGVEVRLPFLDHKIVEFAATLPANFKIREGWTKWILRESFKDLLPKEVCWRFDKIGLEPNHGNQTGMTHTDALNNFKLIWPETV